MSSPTSRSVKACGGRASAVRASRWSPSWAREIDGGDPDQRGPALGERHQGPQRLRVEVAAVLRAEAGGLLRRQREVRGSPPGQPGMQFQQMPSDRRIEPRAQHGGHRRRGVLQEVFEPGQGERVGDQMGVVEDQHRRRGIVGERGDHRLGLTDTGGRLAGARPGTAQARPQLRPQGGLFADRDPDDPGVVTRVRHLPRGPFRDGHGFADPHRAADQQDTAVTAVGHRIQHRVQSGPGHGREGEHRDG